MQNDSQPLDCLNLSVKYVGHWGFLEGLRELYQNFMDAAIGNYPTYKLLYRQQKDGKITYTQARRTSGYLEKIEANYFSYDKKSKTAIMENDSSFPICCMLMGTSIKPPGSLGQFGEGMKVSMIVLMKSGMDISIESGQNIYYPTLKKWDHRPIFVGKYAQDVLYVKYQRRSFAEKTKVTITGLQPQQFQEFLYTSLALLDQCKYEKIKCGGSTLIFPKDPKLVGKVYKKGVRLELHESANSQKFQHYSYDFDQIQTGRDRNCVNNVWDLYKLQSELHYNIICNYLNKEFLSNNPHLKELLKTHLSNISKYLTENNFQTYYFHHYSPKNKAVCDLLYGKFLQRFQNADEMYPKYENELDIHKCLQLYGLQDKFYPTKQVKWQEWHTLIHSNKYQKISQKIQKQIIGKEKRQLTENEAKIVQSIKSKVAVACPEIMEYSFRAKTLKEIPFCKSKDPKQKVIQINPDKFLSNQFQAVRDLSRMLLF